jgi:hypothetical protein
VNRLFILVRNFSWGKYFYLKGNSGQKISTIFVEIEIPSPKINLARETWFNRVPFQQNLHSVDVKIKCPDWHVRREITGALR